MNPLHRDDLPFELAEELTKKLKELHPGSTVNFHGDYPTDKGREIAAKIDAMFQEKLARGECMDCGKKYPWEWPPPGDEEWAKEGWVVYTDHGSDEPVGIVCPECDADGIEEYHETVCEVASISGGGPCER